MHCRSLFQTTSGNSVFRLLARFLPTVALLFTLLAPGLALAQNAKLRLERFGFDKLPDLKVYITYVEEDGTVIAGRQATDFKLQVDSIDQGAGRAITTFDQAKEPIFVVAVVQVGGAVDERVLSEVKGGLRRVNDAVGNTPGGRMGVLAYADKTNRILEFGTTTEVDASIGKIALETEASESHMLDAVRTAIDLLKQQEKGRRKLIILVSDGIDVNNEKKNFTEIGNRAQLGGIVIDTVGYNAFDASKLRNLQEMTKRCYGTDRVAKAPTEIGPKLDGIVDEIQKQYLVTFPLTIAGDDQDHLFQVTHEAGGKPVYSNTIQEKLL
ncbi:MAG TPA: vWA domain-containing protein, partial [Pseudomonadota bacterium]|nr:vWA domain-containing protein [Pseudomonadota bacterium]